MRRTLIALSLCAALVAPTVARADDRDFDIVNNSSGPINGVYVSRSDEDLWGDNVIADSINPGEMESIVFDGELDTCIYDVRVELVDGSNGELREIDLCSTNAITIDDEFITAD